ncbi:MAG: hypothetical protein KGM98_12875 [Bacteroidota bacterium]|nr:hypothetical protein [Bacteroidota bacterium]
MESDTDFFRIKYLSGTLQVERLHFGGNRVFKVLYPGNPVPLLITQAMKSGRTAFWTSIPEGRQQEAEEIGALIENYYNSFA